MDVIEQELKELQAKLKQADEALAAATQSATGSQQSLNEAKAQRNEINQRLMPVAQVGGDLEAIRAALEKQQQSAAVDAKQAEAVHSDLYPVVSDDVSEVSVEAWEKAKVAVGASEQRMAELQGKIKRAETAQKAAQAQAATADASVRELLGQLRNLPNQIQAAGQRVSALVTAARRAFAEGHSGETFVLLSDLKTQIRELEKLASDGLEAELVEKIYKAWETAKKAKDEAAAHVAQIISLRGDLAEAEQQLQQARQALEKARADVIAVKGNAGGGKGRKVEKSQAPTAG